MDNLATTWVGATAKQISRAVRRGDTTATQVVADHLEQIAISDPALAAFRVVRASEAIAEAEKVDDQEDLANLPLAGVPVAVKENTPVAGLPTWNGSAAARSAVAEDDHEVVRRLRGAGAVVVGVTRMPEMGLWGTTDGADEPTRNPWALERTPGGSSGGSAAAVAAGLVPIAHGNDGLGSVRIPAACCGLVGIKPGSGVVPASIDGEPVWGGLSENGPLATTVQDAALALSVMAADPGLAVLGEPGRLRIGVSVRQVQVGLPVDARFVASAKSVAAEFAGLGHSVAAHTRRYPSWLGNGALRSWYGFAYQGAKELDRGRLDRRTRQMATAGRALAALHADGARAGNRWRSGGADAFFGDLDVLLLPALSQPAPAAERWGRRGVLPNTVVSLRSAALFSPWNVAGWPAMSVPAGIDEDGMPVGVQLVARPGRERLLLELAAQFEAVRPWPRHAPDYRDGLDESVD